MDALMSQANVISSLPSLGAAGKATAKLGGANSPQELQKVAKDFESVLLVRLFQAMSSTVPTEGLLNDPTTKQVNDMFWMYLAQDLAENGGMGLWQDIYKNMSELAGQQQSRPALEQLL